MNQHRVLLIAAALPALILCGYVIYLVLSTADVAPELVAPELDFVIANDGTDSVITITSEPAQAFDRWSRATESSISDDGDVVSMSLDGEVIATFVEGMTYLEAQSEMILYCTVFAEVQFMKAVREDDDFVEAMMASDAEPQLGADLDVNDRGKRPRK